MIIIKKDEEIELMRKSCYIAAVALFKAGEAVKPGVTTQHINKIAEDYITSKGAIPSFLNYGSFPASACISVNNEVVHGIPSSNRVLQEGDIVSVDVGAFLNGFHSDNAATFAVGRISKDLEHLLNVTQNSLMLGIKAAIVGARVGAISHAVQTCVESEGLYVVKNYVGHGVGRNLHEDPEVPNFGNPGHGARLVSGMTLAIEPMVNIGTEEVQTQPNGTVVTKDGSYSAHFEHTIALTEDGPQILTLC